MSKNYGPNTFPGQIRRRIWRVTGENPNSLEVPGAAPSLLFHEEEAALLAGDSGEHTLGRTRDILMGYDPSRIIVIRNPATDACEAVGRVPEQLTLAECYAVIYSIGRQAQTDRDLADTAQQAAQVAQP